MPIYMYRCSECSQTCEALQRSSDAPLTECPHCHAQALHKIIAPCGVIFKGHGFYKTDNASGSIHEDHHHDHDNSVPMVTPKKDEAKSTEPAKTAAEPAAKTAPASETKSTVS